MTLFDAWQSSNGGYGARAFQRARECFTARRMTDEYLKLYHRTLQAEVRAA